MCVTLNYRAPELLSAVDVRKAPRLLIVGVDLWAFGATVYEIGSGQMLFPGHSVESVTLKVTAWCEGKPHIDISMMVGRLGRCVLATCSTKPESRPTTTKDMASWLYNLPMPGWASSLLPAPVRADQREQSQDIE